MTSRWIVAVLCGSAIFATGTFARTGPQASGQTALFDPQQLPVFTGQVHQFTLTPRGDIDGMILADGTEVKTPPHRSTQIAYAVRPGDTVTIHGLRAAALPLIQAVSITDQATGRTVIDNGPPPVRLAEIQGRVRATLHGPQGDVNGTLLDDGAILRLPPPEAYRIASLLQPGQTVVAEGVDIVNALGQVVDVREIGPSRDQLSLIAPPPEPGHGRRPGSP